MLACCAWTAAVPAVAQPRAERPRPGRSFVQFSLKRRHAQAE